MGTPPKYPNRKKYVASTPEAPKVEEKPVSEEEHKARLETLKALGLVK